MVDINGLNNAVVFDFKRKRCFDEGTCACVR